MTDLIHEDSKASGRDDGPQIYQDEGSSERQVEMCDDVELRVIVTIENLFLVQVGESNEVTHIDESDNNQEGGRKRSSKQKRDSRLEPDNASYKTTAKLWIQNPVSTGTLGKTDIESSSAFVGEDNDVCKENRFNKSGYKAVLEYRMPLIDKQGSIRAFKFENVMIKLERFQDNAKFEEHEKYACAILESLSKREDPDLQAILLIERGMASYYANDLRKCKVLFDAAIRMGESLVNRSLLEARALYLKSAAYRREKKYNRALRCLQKAELLLSHYESGEDKAELYYNYGSFWLHLHGIKSSHNRDRGVYRQKAEECFEMAIQHGVRDSRSRVRLKKARYYNLRIADLYLDCSSKMARQALTASSSDVATAKKRLDFVQYQLGDDMPLGTRVQLLKTRSDQHYRQGNFCFARNAAKEGLEIALKLETNSSVSSLRERLDELEVFADARLQKSNKPVLQFVAGDSGFSGDCSSDWIRRVRRSFWTWCGMWEAKRRKSQEEDVVLGRQQK